MYTLLLNEQNELITTVKERIMQRSKLVDNLHFLVEPTYKGIDMSTFTCTMEYVSPVSREYRTENLVKSDALYKEMLEYKLPFDTKLTKEAGKIKVQLTFTKASMDAEGNIIQQVRKTSTAVITIVPIAAWSDMVTDDALTALDQRLLMVDSMINAAQEFNQYLYETKADNMIYDNETNTLQLTADGKPIGNKVMLSSGCDGIIAINIDADGNLIAIYADGEQEVVGNVSGDCAGIYVPSMEGDMMTFTLSDHVTENVMTFDVEHSNNWNEISSPEESSNYIWREI